MEIAAPKSESKPRHNPSKRVPPAVIIDVIDDEDDDVSLIYVTPTSCNSGSSPQNAISVENYADDLDLRLGLTSSLCPRKPTRKNGCKKRRIIDLSLFPDEAVVDDGNLSSVIEIGESSNSNSEPLTFMCEICVDLKPYSEFFSIMGCTHFYCSDCMIKYIASKLQENITQIQCPYSDCKRGLLEPEHCRAILPPEVFDRWGNALCEAVILASEKFYCPYKDCSALLIDDYGAGDGVGGEVIRQSECPNCKRMFCVQCKVPWHSEFECAEFQELNKDERGREDMMLMHLAKKKKWMRCPKCKFYVEKSEGCMYMKCRRMEYTIYLPECKLNFADLQTNGVHDLAWSIDDGNTSPNACNLHASTHSLFSSSDWEKWNSFPPTEKVIVVMSEPCTPTGFHHLCSLAKRTITRLRFTDNATEDIESATRRTIGTEVETTDGRGLPPVATTTIETERTPRELETMLM
ncbi:hypothetical protein RHSIM_Rhsim07G0127100 [Rhododendron simsii]|uniref:RBR-type E3 ubiquitin transferase n=1 Tax=Rhododendron simsii TaxID=118357 RepID=A0A834GNE5_RHOSS|nr:hypothetical protein RHSIM_Rhsim07G0127100 [Rhododendron simsii]